jgi:outer membrane protein
MMSKFVRISLALVLGLSLSALAQTTPAASTTAAAPNAPSATPAAPPPSTGTKVGTINIEQAIFASNEGRRDFDTLNKKLEPKQTELKNANDEIDGLKKQLNTTGDKLNDESRAGLVKQIETKQKLFERQRQDAMEEAQGQQGEIAQRILQKMAPVIVKYASENGFGVIIDTSQPWPQGPVVWYGQAVDITEPVVLAYNQVSGVPAPPGGTAKPTGSLRPGASPASKPATTPSTKPATTPSSKPPASNPPKN